MDIVNNYNPIANKMMRQRNKSKSLGITEEYLAFQDRVRESQIDDEYRYRLDLHIDEWRIMLGKDQKAVNNNYKLHSKGYSGSLYKLLELGFSEIEVCQLIRPELLK